VTADEEEKKPHPLYLKREGERDKQDPEKVVGKLKKESSEEERTLFFIQERKKKKWGRFLPGHEKKKSFIPSKNRKKDQKDGDVGKKKTPSFKKRRKKTGRKRLALQRKGEGRQYVSERKIGKKSVYIYREEA